MGMHIWDCVRQSQDFTKLIPNLHGTHAHELQQNQCAQTK